MLEFIISIIGILLTIFFVVGVHEFGHFIVARLSGVKVLRFSIGFGKSLYQRKGKNGTEYVLGAIPLGGYVKMLDEQESPVPENELPFAYNRQPLYKRFAIVAAGVVFNILFSFVIYWALFIVGFTTTAPLVGNVLPNSIAQTAGIKPLEEIVSINNSPTSTWMKAVVAILKEAGEKGAMTIAVKESRSTTFRTTTLNLAAWQLDDLKPEPLKSLGIIPYEPDISTEIGTIKPNSSAYSKLQKGDKILAVDKTPVKNWLELATLIEEHPGQTLSFTVKRQSKIIHVPITINYKRNILLQKTGFLGITPEFTWPPELLREQKFGPIAALGQAWHETRDLINLNLLVLKKLFTGKISIKSLGGPITIFQSAGTALNHGMISFFSFLAFLSIAIATINILPIPGLDGGHVLFQLIELITRRPVSIRLQLLFYRMGLILLMLLITQSFVNDIYRVAS
jgi:regulator of sigma E protease